MASKVLRKVSGTSRRQQYSASTKRALVDVAEELFTENGYAATSLDAIVAEGRTAAEALLADHHNLWRGTVEPVFDQNAY